MADPTRAPAVHSARRDRHHQPAHGHRGTTIKPHKCKENARETQTDAQTHTHTHTHTDRAARALSKCGSSCGGAPSVSKLRAMPAAIVSASGRRADSIDKTASREQVSGHRPHQRPNGNADDSNDQETDRDVLLVPVMSFSPVLVGEGDSGNLRLSVSPPFGQNSPVQ